jgi:hypothetical protein
MEGRAGESGNLIMALELIYPSFVPNDRLKLSSSISYHWPLSNFFV